MVQLNDVSKFVPRKINTEGNNIRETNINIDKINELKFKDIENSNQEAPELLSLDFEEIFDTESSDSLEKMSVEDIKSIAQDNASKILGRMPKNNTLSDIDFLSKLSSEQLEVLLSEYMTYKGNIETELQKETDKNDAAMLNMSKRSINEYISLIKYAKETKSNDYNNYNYDDVKNISYEDLASFYNEYIYNYDRLNNLPSNEDIERWNEISSPANTLKLLEYAKRFEEVEGVPLTVVNASNYQGLFPSINSDLIECYDLMSDNEKKLLMYYTSKYGAEKGNEYINAMLPSWRQRVAYKNVSERINKLTFADEEEITEFDIKLNMEMFIPLDKRNDMSLPVYRTPDEYRNFYNMEMNLPIEQRVSGLIDPDEYERKYKVAYEKASDDLYEKYANGLVKNDLGNLFDVSSSGLNDGVNTFFDGIGKAFATDGELTISDYEKLMYMSYLEGNSTGLTDYYKISSAVGNMLPITTASIMMGFVSPAYASKMAQGLMFSSSYGNTANQMMYQGYDPRLSIFYGLASASTEVALESVGGIFGISDNISRNILVNLGKEGVEEAVQAAVQLGIIDRMMLGKKINLDEIADEMGESFYSGIIVAGILNSYSSTVVNTVDFIYNGNSLTLSSVDFENILKLKEEYNLSYERAFAAYIGKDQHLNQNDWSVLQDLKNFNLERFYAENQNGGIIIITPNQTLGAQTADNGVGEHGDRLNEIYNLIYDNYEPIKSAWQMDPKNGNNIIIQLCTGCESVVWLPDNMNKYQLDILKYFNSEIASIKNKTNVTDFIITSRTGFGEGGFHTVGSDLSSAISEGTKRFNNNIKGNDVVLDLSTLDSINTGQKVKGKGNSLNNSYVRNLDANMANRINTLRHQLVGQNSNEVVVDFLCLALEDAYKRGSNDVDSLINNINYYGINFEMGEVGKGSKSWAYGTVTIDPENIANNDYICVLHEIGHQLHNKINHSTPPSSWMGTMQQMQQIGNYSKNSVIDQANQRRNIRYNESKILLDELLKTEGYATRAEYHDYLNDKYNNIGFFKKNAAKKELRSLGISESFIKDWSTGKKSSSDLAYEIINMRTSELELMASFKAGDITLLDIIDGVYFGAGKDADGRAISGHGEQYYKLHPAEDSYDEIMANYVALKMRNDTETINNLQKVFGAGFIQTLDNEYYRLVK